MLLTKDFRRCEILALHEVLSSLTHALLSLAPLALRLHCRLKIASRVGPHQKRELDGVSCRCCYFLF